MAVRHLKGLPGPLVLLLVAALVALRMFTLEPIEDRQLVRLVSEDLEARALDERAEKMGLSESLGGRTSARKLASTGVEVLSIRASAPLLSFASNETIVLRVRYIVTDAEGSSRARERFYRARHARLADRWQLLPGRASRVSYYLNFF